MKSYGNCSITIDGMKLDAKARSSTQHLWSTLSPGARDDCIVTQGEPCWLCASPWGRGQLVDKWNGKSFTGQNRVRSPGSLYVCEPCVHVCSRIAPVPGRPPKPGKKFGGNFRNYSHCYDAGDYVNFSKGEKPAILEWLRKPKRGPWFCAIADSGQKHTLPWVPVNPGGGVVGLVLFDETTLRLPAELSLVATMASLLTAGATKEEITSGNYRAQTWMRCRADVEAGERTFAPERGGSWFGLALWLAQRDEEKVRARLKKEKEAKREQTNRRAKRKAENKNRRAGADTSGNVPRRVRRKRGAETLGAPANQDAQQRAASDQPRRVGNPDAEGTPTPVGEQGVLPGFG